MVGSSGTPELSRMVELWNRTYPDQFAIDAEILSSHTVGASTYLSDCSIIASDGFVITKGSPADLYPGPREDTAHICALAFESAQTGSSLLEESLNRIKSRGYKRIQFGQDSLHLFPGAPEPCTELKNILQRLRFSEQGQMVDLEHDLSKYEAPVDSRAILVAKGFEVRPAQKEDLVALRDFFNREFPHRWRYDVFNKIEAEGRCDFVFGLWNKGGCEGFALTQDQSHGLPIGGAVWRSSLGRNWGSLGPIGISKSIRGKGLGDALLAATLINMQIKGIRRCIIDWTTLIGFYGKHGFLPTRRYASMCL